MSLNIHYATIPFGMYLAHSVIPLLRARNFVSFLKFVRCAFSSKCLIRLWTSLCETDVPVKDLRRPSVDRFARMLRGSTPSREDRP